ncbi:MAG: co-chaperone DjlA [Gammaproteobacteria bacterium]|nr:MAG: co-chaperone DjlA [Gammaproteobacteria bacterium]
MAWIGKIAGGLLGYAVTRNIVGVVVGVILGHQFDRGLSAGRNGSRRRARQAPSVDRQRLFFETTFLVMGHLAKVDGRVSEAEIGAARGVMRRMRLGEHEMRLAIDLFNTGKKPDFPVDEQVHRLQQRCGNHPELLRLFLEIQVDLALEKGAITPAERVLLGRIATALGVSRIGLAHIEALLRTRRGFGADAATQAPEDTLDNAYHVLGVPSTASDREVKTAYRRLMNEHHPDKQMARGLPDSMLELAEERTREIRAAYEKIRERRGFR